MAARGMSSPVPEIFLDASYAIALASRVDQHQSRAVELANLPSRGAVLGVMPRRPLTNRLTRWPGTPSAARDIALS